MVDGFYANLATNSGGSAAGRHSPPLAPAVAGVGTPYRHRERAQTVVTAASSVKLRPLGHGRLLNPVDVGGEADNR